LKHYIYWYVPHHFIMFVESKSNQGPWIRGLGVINSWHNVQRGGVARWFLFSFSLCLFCPILVDAGGFCPFQGFCRFQGGYINLKYINKDLTFVNWLIIFFSNIYITATFTSLEWGKKSIDCQTIFFKLSYWSSGFLRLVTNNN